MPQFYAETAGVRPLIMPVVQFPDASYHTDSTPILLALEEQFPASRSILPDDEACAFVNLVIEDLADEWLTKSLFHYRFSAPEDQQSGAGWVMDDAYPDIDAGLLASRVEEFIERQVSRMPLVGCTPANAALLERFYDELLDCLEGYVAAERFLFGSRPALADFAIYGQLSTLSRDPRGGRIIQSKAPRTLRWIRRLDDCSGVDGAWCAGQKDLPAATVGLLRLAGTYYFPFLIANAKALAEGAEEVEVEIQGTRYAQPVYRYQGKCLDFLRKQFAALSPSARDSLIPLLEESGCLAALEG